MSTLSELIHYCNEEDPIGALLLTGEWGCGKSYLIENDPLQFSPGVIFSRTFYGAPSL